MLKISKVPPTKTVTLTVCVNRPKDFWIHSGERSLQIWKLKYVQCETIKANFSRNILTVTLLRTFHLRIFRYCFSEESVTSSWRFNAPVKTYIPGCLEEPCKFRVSSVLFSFKSHWRVKIWKHCSVAESFEPSAFTPSTVQGPAPSFV